MDQEKIKTYLIWAALGVGAIIALIVIIRGIL